MSQVQTLTPTYTPTITPTPQVRRRTTVRREAPASLYRCLVVSASEDRLAMLCDAAEAQGWDPIPCDTADEASLEAVRHRLQMLMVDLDGTEVGTPYGFKDLAEQLACDGGRLLVLCGHEDDVMEEVWARQLGAWMYLPGVDDQSDVAMVCGEARNVTEKSHGTAALEFAAT